jgi:hypothetical protein
MKTGTVSLYDDRTKATTNAHISGGLADLFSYAHQWALAESRTDTCTLTFSSMLAAMVGGSDPLCAWLRSHLSLRGVRAESMTKSRSFSEIPLPAPLNTTYSFRQALRTAQGLLRNEQEPLAVRHFMAAYAVVPRYHIHDFLRLRIDRRAWCIELAEHLAHKFPEEKETWVNYAQQAPPVPSLGFNTDAPAGRDLLNVDREVEAFARLITSRNTATPLSVGLFGAWGSGKSFFMHRLRKRVENFASLGNHEGAKSKYHGAIAQIDFNAWHYSEGNLAASFVNHILRNLRVKPDESEEELRQRGELVVKQLDTAIQDLALREKALADAEEKRSQALSAIAELDAKIGGEIEAKKSEVATARAGVQDARDKLSTELEDLKKEIERESRRIPAAAVARRMLDKLSTPEITKALNSVNALIAETQAARANRKLILYGLLALGVTATATLLMKTETYSKAIAAAVAVGGFATAATSWLKKLNALAQSGKELEEEQSKMRQTIEKEITAAHSDTVSGLNQVVVNKLTALQTVEQQLKQLENAPAAARLALESLEKDRADLVDKHAQAAAAVEAKKAAVAKLTTGTLLEEFLDARASDDGYLKQLTIFSKVRNDFEKLSRLMTRSNDDYVAEKRINEQIAQRPVVSRIVLYIDDLDRCAAERVVEVLQLVHLLLAFPLFVCVAAVDPRWVTRCLKQAPGLIDLTDKDREPKIETDDQFGVVATPADYLEKIFQIPLWLRPVPSDQRAAIVRALLDPLESLEELPFDLRVRKSQAPMDGELSPERSDEKGGAEAKDAETNPDIISEEELKYLDRIAPLLDGNPRALKRFVNTYRLVKTALSEVELAVFSGASDIVPYSPYRICMAQLAVLCTQRQRALALVRHADQTIVNATLGGWLDELGKTEGALADALRRSLKEDLENTDLDQFKMWLARTRRYSFYL